jgi:hypothetical protein
VGDGENPEVPTRFEIDDVIRETHHGTTTNREVSGNSGHERVGSRELNNVINGRIDSIEELDAEMLAAFFVVATGETVLDLGLFFKSNARVH